jgi:hypothetical protein
VDFFCVYIQEAHPTDGWQVLPNVNEGVLYAQPKDADARAEIASTCVRRLALEMPTLLDAMTNETDAAYAALPERLYLVDAAGRIAYRGEPGPFGFDPDAWEEAIRRTVG